MLRDTVQEIPENISPNITKNIFGISRLIFN